MNQETATTAPQPDLAVPLAGPAPPAAGSRLGDRVRALRLAAGLTQSGLAGDKFSKEYVSQIERGKTRPTDETIRSMTSSGLSNFGSSSSG
jgi:ribosome-binding protein aMBF1 (putative translation factor)